jgi:chromosome segregation ATPase
MMTDEELIAMARLAQRDERMSTGALYGDLADRIEALTEQLTAARDDAKEAEAYAEELEQRLATCRMAQAVMDNTVADLEGKLAKAVEGFEVIRDRQYYRMGPGITAQVIARATLAEIKGES